MAKSYDDLVEEIEADFEPEAFYDYDDLLNYLRNNYGTVIDSLDLSNIEDTTEGWQYLQEEEDENNNNSS